MSGTRAPRVQVLADGSALPGVLAADVFANNHLAADRFRLRIAAAAADLAGLQAPGLRLDVQVGWDGGWTSLLVGTADALAFDPVRGVVEVEGRDLSAGLIETQASETFANRTASEIVELIAARRGTGWRRRWSRHRRRSGATTRRSTTGWRWGSSRGRRRSGTCWRSSRGRRGSTCSCRATRCASGRRAGTPCRCGWRTAWSLELEHALGLARSVEVTVRSWGTRAGVALEHTARGSGGGKTGGGKPLRHVLVRPNLDAGQAQRVAERALAELRRHEWTVQAALPGELGLTPRSRVALVGTGTDWDRVYAVAELSRHLDVRRGFTQRLCLRGA